MGLLSGIGSLIGGGLSLFSGKEQGRRYEKAGRQAAAEANKGFDWILGNTNLQGYAGDGRTAADVRMGALGLGGGEASQAAFDNFLNSTGYNFRLKAGQDAIGAGMSAAGKLNSGARDKALVEYGQNLGGDYFDNWMAGIGGVADRGFAADTALGDYRTGASARAGEALYNGITGGADARAGGQAGAAAGAGGAWEAIFGGG